MEGTWARQPEPVPPPPLEEKIVLPAGTELTIRVLDRISSQDARSGERFAAVLDHNIRQDDRVVLSANSEVTGLLVSVKESGRVSGRAEIVLELESIRIQDQEYDLRTSQVTLRAESSAKGDAAKIAGGAALGAIIGAITGGKKGAAVGATVGAGSGTATVMTTRGKPVEIERESQLNFRLKDPLEIVIR